VGKESKPKVVACPQCGGSVEWRVENRFRPFCSERCRLLDLGAWASEQYRIATPEPAQTPDEEK